MNIEYSQLLALGTQRALDDECSECKKKQKEIDQLRKEIEQLQDAFSIIAERPLQWFGIHGEI